MFVSSVVRAEGHSPFPRPAAGALWSSCGPPGSPPHSCTGSERSDWTHRPREPLRCWNCTRLPAARQTDREEEKVDYSSAVHITASSERDCPLCEHQSTFRDASCRKRDVDVSFIFSLLFSDGIFWQRLAELWFEAFRIREEEKRQMKILTLSETRAYTYTVIIYLNYSS